DLVQESPSLVSAPRPLFGYRWMQVDNNRHVVVVCGTEDASQLRDVRRQLQALVRPTANEGSAGEDASHVLGSQWQSQTEPQDVRKLHLQGPRRSIGLQDTS